MKDEKLQNEINEIHKIVMTNDEKKSVFDNVLRISSLHKYTKPVSSIWTVFSFSSYFHNSKLLYYIIIPMIFVLSSGGLIFASEKSLPGSFLFPVELALENIQLELSGDDKKEELRLRFTEERLEEIREVSEKRSVPSDVLDKEFLNKNRSINFSEDENEDVSQVLSDIDKFLNQDGNNQNKEELRESLVAILVLLGDDGKLEIKRDDGKIKIETKNGEVKIKVKVEDDNSGKSIDDNDEGNSKDDDSIDDNDGDDLDNDVKEDDSEVFCRGEWRDAEDCEDGDNDKNNKRNDN